MAIDRFEGDPRIVITEHGSDFVYEAGQPIMDTGVENTALLSLFTQEGWAGNVFLPIENRVGSDFEKTSQGSITLSKLADIENSAERALTGKTFSDIETDITNPTSNHLKMNIKVGPGQALNISNEGARWRNQAERPASSQIIP